jgi:deazaflavin-dependent oxidoreductase (nitroreductase family)
LTVFSTDDGVAVILTYGPNRDWLKNIIAAGGGSMRRYGKTFQLTNPRVMPKAEAAPAVKGWMRPLFARMPVEQAVVLTRAG